MKTVTGLFNNYDAAKDAVNRLESAGFPSNDISIVSHHREGESNAGAGAGVGACPSSNDLRLFVLLKIGVFGLFCGLI